MKFTNSKVATYYFEVCNALQGKQKEQFKKEIDVLYDKKITSEVDLPDFLITKEDIDKVLVEQCFVKRPELILNK